MVHSVPLLAFSTHFMEFFLLIKAPRSLIFKLSLLSESLVFNLIIFVSSCSNGFVEKSFLRNSPDLKLNIERSLMGEEAHRPRKAKCLECKSTALF